MQGDDSLTLQPTSPKVPYIPKWKLDDLRARYLGIYRFREDEATCWEKMALDQIARCVDWWNIFQPRRGLPPLAVVLVKGDRLGAEALVSPEPYEYCVFVRDGSAQIIVDLFGRMLDTRGSLPILGHNAEAGRLRAATLGSPSLSSSTLDRGAIRLADVRGESTPGYPVVPELSNADESLRQELFRQAISFIFFHEQCHIDNGHIRAKQLHRLDDLEKAGRLREVDIAFEMDADAFATSRIMRTCMPRDPLPLDVELQRIQVATIAILSIINLEVYSCEESVPGVDDPILRWLRASNVLHGWIDRHRPDRADALHHAVLDASQACDHAFGLVFLSMKGLRESRMERLRAVPADRLVHPLRVWREIRPRLIDLAHGSELIPAKDEEDLRPLSGSILDHYRSRADS